MESNCIFCKINSNQIPSYTLYEDNLVRAFLDVNPVSIGHTLVVPKDHYENIFVTPDNVLERINSVCKKIALICQDRLKSDGVNILNASGISAQQSVFHLHYHVVPRFSDDALNLWFHQEAKSDIDILKTYDLLK